MQLHQKTELITLAQNFLDGKVEQSEVRSLNVIEQLFVHMQAAVYSCTRCGTMSPKSCAVFKYDAISVFELLSTRLCWEMQAYDNWIAQMKKFSGLKCRLIKELNGEKPDAEAAFKLALEIIDLLTKDNVFLDMGAAACMDSEFLKNCQKAYMQNEDKLREQFGGEIKAEDYPRLIERFYEACTENRIAKLFEDCDGEFGHQTALAKKGIPVKTENLKAAVANVRKMYAS